MAHVFESVVVCSTLSELADFSDKSLQTLEYIMLCKKVTLRCIIHVAGPSRVAEPNASLLVVTLPFFGCLSGTPAVCNYLEKEGGTLEKVRYISVSIHFTTL